VGGGSFIGDGGRGWGRACLGPLRTTGNMERVFPDGGKPDAEGWGSLYTGEDESLI